MKKFSFFVGPIILGLILTSAGRQETRAVNLRVSPRPSRNLSLQSIDFARTPLYFIPNKGQVDGQALFYAKTPSYTLWLKKEGLVFDSAKRQEKAGDRKGGGFRIKGPGPGPSAATYERDVSRVIFLNTNKSPEVTAQDPCQYLVNYFIGNDPAKWRTNIETSRAVLYKELYPNIDLKVYGVEKQIEYDWMVKPGGAVENIRFEYRNVMKTEIDQGGNLIICTKFGGLMHKKPVSYQMIDGHERRVQVAFRTIAKDTYGFQAEAHDPACPLIIDPMILVYSTYLGGAGGDGASDIAVDSTGSVYLTGGTDASGFPVSNPFDSTWHGLSDVIVTKFTSDGRALAYSTYLGGSAWDSGYGIAVDSDGCAYVIGRTVSSDFPVFNAFDATFNGGYDDAFVAKLSPSGNVLIYSTFLGGFETESGSDIAIDAARYVYVTGSTSSPDFPVVNAYDPYWNGSSDVFVAKFTPDGGALAFSTFLGGSSIDDGSGIAVDGAGSAYVTGTTYSMYFPVFNAYDPIHNGVSDAFVTKFAPDGKSLVYSTFLGGADSEFCNDIAVDGNGSAYITGGTYSSNFPAVKAFDSAQNGGEDAFVAAFTPEGNALAYSTYLGGTKPDDGSGIAVDSDGAAYVVGSTYSSDFPVLNAFSPTLKNYSEAFVTKFSPAGQSLAYSTFLGGDSVDYGRAIAVDSAHDAYVTGNTASSDFPVPNAYDPTPNGNTDIFVTKLRLIPPYPPNNFMLQRLENNYIFYRESINRLSWTANPENTSKITKYRLYRKVKGAADSTYQWLADASASGTSFGYDDRRLKKTALYTYRIASVDETGRESSPAEAGN